MRTDPEDVARVESKTFICTERREDTIPSPAPGVEGTLGKWESPDKMKKKLFEDKFPGCMKGRARSLILCVNYISHRQCVTRYFCYVMHLLELWLSYKVHKSFKMPNCDILSRSYHVCHPLLYGTTWFTIIKDWCSVDRFTICGIQHANHDQNGS